MRVILNYKIALWIDFIICKWIYLKKSSRNPISVMIESCGFLVYIPPTKKNLQTTNKIWLEVDQDHPPSTALVQLNGRTMYWLYTGVIQRNEILYDSGDNEKYSSGCEVWRVSGRLFISHQQIRMGVGGFMPLQRFK